MESISCDVIVIGSGGAGLRAAISVREAGLNAMVLSKAKPGKSTCTAVSGGVMAGSEGPSSWESHLENTLRAGRGINEQSLARVLVKEAPVRHRELVDWGIRAEFRKGYLYAKGHPPMLGGEITRCLIEKCIELGTGFLSGCTVTDLSIDDRIAGVSAYLRDSGKYIKVTAKAVVLATGGAGALYARHDNPLSIMGDGYRLALEAGAILQDMEFVQFYPLCVAEPGLPPLVIPPKLADCGRLSNENGEDILGKYGIIERPAGERARDKLSRALFQEINREGRAVYLDLRRVGEDPWMDPFAASIRHILGKRFGAFDRAIRIAPAAHHVMGGVKIDEYGKTSIPGLFAAGEVTGGLHGANRMGGNALSDILVFGARAGIAAAAYVSEWPDTENRTRSIAAVLDDRMQKWTRLTHVGKDFRPLLQKMMWTEGGIIRNAEGLNRAMRDVKMLEEKLTQSSSEGRGDLAETVSNCSAARTAGLILQAAIRRTESRGAHYREDFPDQDDESWRGHLQVRMLPGGEDLGFSS